MGKDTKIGPIGRTTDFCHQNKPTFKNAGNGKGDEKTETNENDVICGKGRDDGAHGLNGGRDQHGQPTAEPVRGPAEDHATDKDAAHVTTLDGGEQG